MLCRPGMVVLKKKAGCRRLPGNAPVRFLARGANIDCLTELPGFRLKKLYYRQPFI